MSSRSSPSRTPAGWEGPRGRRREGVAGRERSHGRPRRGHPLRLPHQPRLRERDGPHPFLYALEDEASRAAMLGVPYLVMHPGSCGDDPVEEGISRIASAIRSFGKFPEG